MKRLELACEQCLVPHTVWNRPSSHPRRIYKGDKNVFFFRCQKTDDTVTMEKGVDVHDVVWNTQNLRLQSRNTFGPLLVTKGHDSKIHIPWSSFIMQRCQNCLELEKKKKKVDLFFSQWRSRTFLETFLGVKPGLWWFVSPVVKRSPSFDTHCQINDSLSF